MMRLRTAAESVPGEQYKSELKAKPESEGVVMFASGVERRASGSEPGAGERDHGNIAIGTGGIGTRLVLR
jgi:hypothetical protein